jgi:microsomal dipeptidase-like Zn-dependent dipeptidase
VIVLAGALLCAGLPTCSSTPLPPSPQACSTIPAQRPGVPTGSVWGFADLHSHPAIELAFDRALIWGGAIDSAPVNAAELPVIDACPVETHEQNASTPLDRAVGTLLFPGVSSQGHFAHAPVGDIDPPSTAWPNARDVIHQQMNVSSIRRAYEAGLRLMFASTTDDQVISALLSGPNALNGFVPDESFDLQSARRQIEFIQGVVERNKTWMWLARTPQDARNIIQGGRLAVVLSLEMNGLSESDLNTLVKDYGVAHVIPVHLLDNDVGGTATNGPLFNTDSAMVSEIYRNDHGPMRFMDVAASTRYARNMTWPNELTNSSPPIDVGLQPIPYQWYADLCYEPLYSCEGTPPPATDFLQLGQRNFRGLCSTAQDCLDHPDAGDPGRPGIPRIRAMMNQRLIVDVSHMSAASVVDSLTVEPDTDAPINGYPLIASHGDFVHMSDIEPPPDPSVCPLGPGSERSLDATAASQIVARGGVLGLGSGTGTYGTHVLFDVRGGPLLTVSTSNGQGSTCLAMPSQDGTATSDCAPVPDVAPGVSPAMNVDALQITTVGGISGPITSDDPSSYPFALVELADPTSTSYQHHILRVPMQCSAQGCSATVPLGKLDRLHVVDDAYPGASCAAQDCATAGTCGATPYTMDDIAGVSLEWSCQSGLEAGPDSWTVEEADIAVSYGGNSAALVHLGGAGQSPVTVLGGSRGSYTVYGRSDRPAATQCQPTTGHLLQISITSGSETTLLGAGPSRRGANVCAAVRSFVNGACSPSPPPAEGATECPDGWVKMNQRGTWGTGINLYAFTHSAGAATDICGVDVAVLDMDSSQSSWTIDEVTVSAAEDPVGHWIQRYAEVSRYVAKGRMGAVAFGTDFNGLNGLTDISEFAVPPSAVLPTTCFLTETADAGPGTMLDATMVDACANTTRADAEASADAGELPDAGDAGRAIDGGHSADAGDAGDARDAGDAGSAAIACAPPSGGPLAPMRLRNPDGTVGAPVLINERGLATYGMLADLMAIIAAYPGCGADVHDSLMLSAEATLRAWEDMTPSTAPPTRSPLPDAGFVCAKAPWFGP